MYSRRARLPDSAEGAGDVLRDAPLRGRLVEAAAATAGTERRFLRRGAAALVVARLEAGVLGRQDMQVLRGVDHADSILPFR